MKETFSNASPTIPVRPNTGKTPAKGRKRTISPAPVAKKPATQVAAGSRALAGQLTLCEQKAVGAAATQSYKAFENQFRLWVARNGRSMAMEHLETSLVDYLDSLLEAKKKAGDAEKVVAAMLAAIPGVDRKNLSRINRALRGFRKANPPLSKEPLFTKP